MRDVPPGTERAAAAEAGSSAFAGPGAHAARDHARRLVREQLAVVAVLVAALAVTLALLALQWLNADTTTGPNAPPPQPTLSFGGTT